MSTPYDAMYDELRRGVSPEVAKDLGYPVPPHRLQIEEAESAPHSDEIFHEPIDDHEVDHNGVALEGAIGAVASNGARRQLTIADARRNAERYRRENPHIR